MEDKMKKKLGIKSIKKLGIKSIKKREPVFDQEVVAVIKQSIASELTDPELKVYLGVCRRYQADPIMKDIVPVVFKSHKTGQRTLNFIVTRDFLLKKANKSGLLDGLHSKIVRDDKGKIIGATAEAWKVGSQHSFQTEVDFKEYYNETNLLWGKFPGAMIRKVAETIVLKQLCGIDIVSDIELAKNGGSMISISDITVPKTRFIVSDSGKIKTKIIEEKKDKEEMKVL